MTAQDLLCKALRRGESSTLKKRFGQHFLTDPSILRRIVQFARLTPEDTVVEIGPGAGSLTLALAAAVHRVIAIEIDRALIAELRARLPSNVEIIEGDALEAVLPQIPFHVVANLPYNIATPLLRRFIDYRDQILGITVMIQKEVADRLSANPRTRDYGPLSVLIQYYATVAYGFTVPPGAFKPPPKVNSAVVRIDWKPRIRDDKRFTGFVHKAFSSRRKKLANNLQSMFGSESRAQILQRLESAGIGPNARPEELSVAEFLRVYNQFRM